jgi:hypothetical protein
LASRAIAPTAGKWENDQSVAATGTSALMIEAARAIANYHAPIIGEKQKKPVLCRTGFLKGG